MNKRWFYKLFRRRLIISILIVAQAAFLIWLVASGSAVSHSLNTLLHLLSFLAVLYIVLKKPWCIRVLYWMAFLSATAATLPVLARGDVLVLPNTGLPLMMIAQWLLAAWLKKKPLAEEQPQKTAPRLKGR